MARTARDRVRQSRHNRFESVHRLGGWAALGILAVIVPVEAARSLPPGSGPAGLAPPAVGAAPCHARHARGAPLAGRAPPAGRVPRGYQRGDNDRLTDRGARVDAAIARVARAASRPWWRLPPPARASACSMFSTGERRSRTARRCRSETWDPARGLGAHVVVVRGLAADHRAEAHDARVAARLGRVLGGQRQLERARHVEHVDVAAPAAAEHLPRARDEPLGQVLVEAPDARSRSGRSRAPSVVAARGGRRSSLVLGVDHLLVERQRPGGGSCGPCGRAWRAGSASLCGLGIDSIGICSVTDRP